MVEHTIGVPAPGKPEPGSLGMWPDIKKKLKKKLGEDVYFSWIDGLECVECDNERAKLHAQSSFIADWVSEYYSKAILQGWQSLTPAVRRVEIQVSPAQLNDEKRSVLKPDQGDGKAAPTLAAQPLRAGGAARGASVRSGDAKGDAKGVLKGLVGLPLDPRFTFENFVVGDSNRLAFAAAEQVARANGTAPFNPLFLHGRSGVGKTHLLHAIGWEMRKLYPSKRVIYLSADQFMCDFVSALRNKDTLEFKRQCRSVDLLMIDDIQFFAGRDSTREEFIHTLNALMAQNRQIVLSADKAPANLDGVEEFLATRLSGGLCAEFHLADYAMRLAILESKAAQAKERLGVEIGRDVLEFLAERISSTGRDLEGALNKVVCNQQLSRRVLTVDVVKSDLEDILRSTERRITIDEIQKTVARHFGLSTEELLSKRRHRSVVRPRQVAMYLSKTHTTRSLPEIGRRFGNRDHTTVIHAVRKVEELIGASDPIGDDVDLLARMLRN